MNVLLAPCFVSPAWELGSSDPEPEKVQFQSLWDTGATVSVVSRNVAEKLGLKTETYAEAHHVYGKEDRVPVHYVNLVLPNNVPFRSIRVLQGDLTGFDVLIGMDVINTGDFVVTNRNGATKFSFRVPSVESFNFVKDDNIYNRRQANSEIHSPPTRSSRRRKKKKKK